MTAPFDPGLQPERTELAWRRTCLALGAGSLVSSRILPEVFANGLWALCGFAGVLAAGGIWAAARRRYRRVVAVLDEEGDRARLPDGKLGLAMTAFVTTIAIAGVAVIVLLQ